MAMEMAMKPIVIFLLTRPIKEETNVLPHLFISLASFPCFKIAWLFLTFLKLYRFRYPFNVFSVCHKSNFKNRRYYEYFLPASFAYW